MGPCLGSGCIAMSRITDHATDDIAVIPHLYYYLKCGMCPAGMAEVGVPGRECPLLPSIKRGW